MADKPFAARLAALHAAVVAWQKTYTWPAGRAIEEAIEARNYFLGNRTEAILALVEAVQEELEAERQVAIQSPSHFGLGPDEVFERRDAAIRNKWAAVEALNG